MGGVRALSLNVNGWRAACRKGLLTLLEQVDADVLCFQEVKAHDAALCALPPGYRAHWHLAARKGYSGVALLSRKVAERVVCGLGDPLYDSEGRVLQADFGSLSVLSVYVPSGSSGEARQAFKMQFLATFYDHLRALLAEGRELLICGDLNVAHRKIDLKNWRSNQRSSGFLPEERAWFSALLDLGLVDAFRQHAGPERAAYSWWSLRSGARARNVGWRLDYQLVTPGLAGRIISATIPREPCLSDHAPVILDYEGTLL